MDLSKAFDCIPHGLLLTKLKCYGLSDQACLLLKSYISDRKQRVKVGHSRSKWGSVAQGVPQGSILGPLIFNIFINDIFYALENVCNLYNYADDNTLLNTHHSIHVLRLSWRPAPQSQCTGLTSMGWNRIKLNFRPWFWIIIPIWVTYPFVSMIWTFHWNLVWNYWVFS